MKANFLNIIYVKNIEFAMKRVINTDIEKISFNFSLLLFAFLLFFIYLGVSI